MYAPQLGRFISRDPIGYVDGKNLYSAFKESPNRWLDPSGTTTNDCMLVTGGTAYDPKGWTYVMEWIGNTQTASTQEAGLSLSVMTVLAIFVRKYRELYQCCDCAGQVYWRWGDIAVEYGTTESSGSEADGTVLAVGTAGTTIKVPSPFPGVKLPIRGLKTNFAPWGFTQPNWKGYKNVGPTPSGTNPADSPPQDDPLNPQGFNVVPASQFSCSGGLAPTRAKPDPARF